jgi:hypothetical protein
MLGSGSLMTSLPADTASTLAVVERTEGRVRGTTGLPLGVDFVETLGLRLQIAHRQWDAVLGFTPSFTLADLEAGFNPQSFNYGSAGIAWHNRRVRVGVTEDATYGYTSYTYLIPAQAPTGLPGQMPQMQPPPGIQQIPTTNSFQFVSTRSVLTTDMQITRRLSSAVYVGYALGGGADEVSRQTIPVQRGPFGHATMGYALSREDTVRAVVTARHMDSTATTCLPVPPPPALPSKCVPEATLADATLGEQHRWSRTLTTSLRAGASYIHARQDTGRPFDDSVLPLAELYALQQIGGHQLTDTLSLTLRLAPYVDVVSGIVTEQLSGFLAAVVHESKRTYLVDVGAYESIPSTGPNAIAGVTAGAEARQALSRHLDLAGGERFGYVHANSPTPGLGGADIWLTVTYVALVFHEPYKL